MEEGGVHWRAGANQPAQPCRAHVPSLLPRSDTAESRAPDRVRPAAPRGRHARPPMPRLPPPPVDSASALATPSSTPCAPPRSLSRSLASAPRAHRTTIAIGAPSSAPTVLPQLVRHFFDSSFPDLRSRFSIAGHASKRLVTHGETLLALAFFSSESAVLRVWPARHPAFLRLLASASCSPLHRKAPKPSQTRSTGPAPRVDGEQRHHSTMASDELTPVRPRSRIGAHRVRLEP